MLPRPTCMDCRHADWEHFYATRKLRCKAYPERVPDMIKLGVHDHRTPYPGDHGVLFEPREGELPMPPENFRR